MRKLVSLILLLVAVGCFAADGYRSILLECSVPPGQQLRIQLDASLSIRYDYGLMQVSGRRVYVQVPLDNIVRWTFSNQEVDGVDGEADTLTDGTGVNVSAGSVTLSGVPAGTDVSVCDSAGRVVRYAVAEGECEMSLDGLPTGVYFLMAGGQKYRIVVR